ncbi:MAG: hypothetical protein HY221_02215 [Candidatus Sungbacteria bacterium]|uniref:Mur ligase central domain-containing protein n=1 Tax=Candidatus Sungiibacteriota bacterium TaxID=2750080 RepID=A0A932R0B9_9BACT|nr:hypothetical protein [Candidatus Sungbacteria bacterium]
MMTKKSILQKILAVLARATIRAYKPVVVGITGSVGKTSTRLATYAVVKKKFRVRTAEKNYNNEIGLALTILGIPHYGRNIFGWISGLAPAAMRLVIRNPRYPEILVLEYGVDRPGDMDYLVSLARPEVAVVTAIGEVPAHVEFFENPEALAREKAKLVAALPSAGFAILNHDDYAAYDMRGSTPARVITFGQEEHAEVRMDNYEFRIGPFERYLWRAALIRGLGCGSRWHCVEDESGGYLRSLACVYARTRTHAALEGH